MAGAEIRGKAVRFFKWLLFSNHPLALILFILIAFPLLKFAIWPMFLHICGLADVVTVTSPSMTHKDEEYRRYLKAFGFTDEMIENMPFRNGLQVGDVLPVKKVDAEEIEVGDVIVFRAPPGLIIHRVVLKIEEGNSTYFVTKGDANPGLMWFETNISEEQIVGKALFRIPLLGYPRVLIFKLFRV